MGYDAREFLRNLFEADRPKDSPAPSSAVPSAPAPDPETRDPAQDNRQNDRLMGLQPDDLPPAWRLEWEERAAVREYEGGQAREHAEAEALKEILERMWRISP